MTDKQKMWANVFSCAVERSNIYFKEKDLDRHAREHSTVMLAIQIGDSFWRKLL